MVDRGKNRSALWLFALLLVGTLVGIRDLDRGDLWAQADKKTFDVKLTADDVYSFDKLTYQGDYLQFTAANGQAALGTTEKGVTVLILSSGGEFKITAPADFEEKAKQAFETYPVAGKFTRAYIRLRPEDYEAMTKNVKLTKLQDEKLFNQAKEIYGEKFFGSYHAGDKATFPPEQSVYVDFETESFGQMIVEDGFWLRLIRITPYKSVYPRGFEKPAKKSP